MSAGRPAPSTSPPLETSVSPAEPRGPLEQLRALVRSSEALLVLLAVLIGGGAGVLVTLMTDIAQLAHTILFGIPLDQRLSASARVGPITTIAAPVCGGLILGAMEIWRRSQKIRAAVDPVEANALHGGRMSLRDSLVVSFQTLISNGCGASVGLEAGYTQIGAGLASRIGATLKLRRSDMRILVGCGAAAAIAAAFGAPLTGAFYAFELIIGVYAVASVAPVLAASLAAVLTTQALGGSPYSIQVVSLYGMKPIHYLVVALLGLLIGALGILVMRAVVLVERGFELTRLPYWARPAAGGLAVGLLALITPQVLAAGHGAMLLDLPRQMPFGLLAMLIGLKVLASLISLGAGFRGGLFFASLFVGSLAGKLFGEGEHMLFPDLGLDPTICVMAGMGTLAVAIVGGPLTMSFLVLETTKDFSVTTAVLAACIATSLFVRQVFGYSFSTWRLHLRGETVRSANDVGWMRQLTVGRLMRRDPRTIPAVATVAEFRRRNPLGSASTVVLLDDQDRYAGLVAVTDAFADDRDAEAATTPVSTLARLADTALTPELNVKDIMAAFDRTESETLAVVDTPASRRLMGVVTESYVTRRYAEELDQATRSLTGAV